MDRSRQSFKNHTSQPRSPAFAKMSPGCDLQCTTPKNNNCTSFSASQMTKPSRGFSWNGPEMRKCPMSLGSPGVTANAKRSAENGKVPFDRKSAVSQTTVHHSRRSAGGRPLKAQRMAPLQQVDRRITAALLVSTEAAVHTDSPTRLGEKKQKPVTLLVRRRP